jgi:hypothetical protein
LPEDFQVLDQEPVAQRYSTIQSLARFMPDEKEKMLSQRLREKTLIILV